MELSMVIVIAGAACLAKSMMGLFDWMEHPAKGTKKDRAAAANNCTVGSYTR